MYSREELAKRLGAPPQGKLRREDGYINLLNRYGTQRDSSEAYSYEPEGCVPDEVLTSQYATNGLFAKIIDIPAQEAAKGGFSLNIGDRGVAEYLERQFGRLRLRAALEEALKWSRLYGGALAVMIIDDGSENLEAPADWACARSVEEIAVYERACVQPDYASLYAWRGTEGPTGRKGISMTRRPEYYSVYSAYGSFRVHESRCLVFRNGRMPERVVPQTYRYWGVPEYARIRRALRETVTAHSNAGKMLERSVQAIYKMRNLAQLLSTDEGEDAVLRRLQVIDESRGIMNSMAIDAEGEDYSFQTFALSGISEAVNASCNMLSAITEIPQTKLFGRSPAGMNATGDGDLENYYGFISKIQETQLRDNICLLTDALIRCAVNTGKLPGVPPYRLEFRSLWSMSDADKAKLEQTRAQTEMTRAQMAQMYIQLGILSPEEERRRLRKAGLFGITDDALPQQGGASPAQSAAGAAGGSGAAEGPEKPAAAPGAKRSEGAGGKGARTPGEARAPEKDPAISPDESLYKTLKEEGTGPRKTAAGTPSGGAISPDESLYKTLKEEGTGPRKTAAGTPSGGAISPDESLYKTLKEEGARPRKTAAGKPSGGAISPDESLYKTLKGKGASRRKTAAGSGEAGETLSPDESLYKTLKEEGASVRKSARSGEAGKALSPDESLYKAVKEEGTGSRKTAAGKPSGGAISPDESLYKAAQGEGSSVRKTAAGTPSGEAISPDESLYKAVQEEGARPRKTAAGKPSGGAISPDESLYKAVKEEGAGPRKTAAGKLSGEAISPDESLYKTLKEE